MEKIKNKKILDIFKDEDLEEALDEMDRYLSDLEKIKRNEISYKFSNAEAKDVGSVLHNIDIGLSQYVNSTVFKFLDLFNGAINCINNKDYSSSITIARALFEHFAMFALKTDLYSKYIKSKEYLKISSDLMYWAVPESMRALHPNYKRTHIMDAIRFLDEMYKENLPEKYFEDKYHSFSESVHPASNSLLINSESSAKEKWDSDGFKLDTYYSKDVKKFFLDDLLWAVSYLPGQLMRNIYPLYNNNVLIKWDEIRKIAYDYFKENPEKANEILNKTINKELNDLNRKVNNKEDIDILRYKNIKNS